MDVAAIGSAVVVVVVVAGEGVMAGVGVVFRGAGFRA